MELVSPLIVIEFVVVAGVVILLVGLNKTVGVVPLFLTFVVVLLLYVLKRP